MKYRCLVQLISLKFHAIQDDEDVMILNYFLCVHLVLINEIFNSRSRSFTLNKCYIFQK